MATLRAESFADINIRERSTLAADVAEGAQSITVESTWGYAAQETIYLGQLAREGCERAVIASVDDETTMSLAEPLKRAHRRSAPVTSVVGDRLRIYRAPNVSGAVPADDAFTVLATRSIDPDQPSTYYRDNSGGSDYWYRITYYNETTLEETELAAAAPFRGAEYEHYVSLSDIRREAGFQGAHNLGDDLIDAQRIEAETEVNTALRGSYEVPFKKVPADVKVIVTNLAAGLLRLSAFRGSDAQGDKLVKDARARLAQLSAGDSTLSPDDGGVSLGGEAISSWPNDSTASTPVSEGGGERMFHIGDVY